MKRFFILLLAGLLLTGCSAGKEDSAEPAPTATPMPPPTGLVRQETQEYRAISASPDGEVELCVRDGALYIRRGESVIPVTANEKRGVPDAYGHLAEFYGLGAQAIGNGGVTWSPDGRYITLINYASSDFIDPHVIDMASGEMYLLSTCENRMIPGAYDIAYMLNAVYSPDSRYLYALMSGSHWETRYHVVRYDLATYEAVPVGGTDDFTPGNGLCCLGNDAVIFNADGRISEGAGTGLVLVSPHGEAWTNETYAFDIAEPFCKPVQILCASGEGWALMLMSGSNDYAASDLTRLVRMHPDRPLEDTDTCWRIPALDAEAAVTENVSDLESYRYPNPGFYEPGVRIRAMALSPDGQYAILLCNDRGDDGFGPHALLLLRLSDMTLTRLSGVGAEMLADAGYLAWCGDTVYLGPTIHEAVAYTLQY